jgi:uncharacterized membrane protein
MFYLYIKNTLQKKDKNILIINIIIKNKYNILLFIMFSIYSFFWSYITIMRYYSLQSAVYDLGLYQQELWLVYNVHWSFISFLRNFLARGTMFLFFPISFFNSYPLTLSFQTLFLASAVFPIYGIGRKFLKSDLAALIISASYLIYFPLAGVNWFDVHNQAFFIPLFLFAYYFYLNKRYKLSLVFFILSGISKYPFIIFVVLFSIISFIEILYEKIKLKNYNTEDYNFLLYLTIISLVILALSYYIINIYSGLNMYSYTHLNSGVPLYNNIDIKIFTILLMFAPFFIFSLFSRKWILFFIPFFSYVFISNNYIYTFPSVFHLQYTSSIIPFIYISAIEGISNIQNNELKSISSNNISHKNFEKLLRKKEIKMTIAIFLVVFLLAIVYEPYGPLNQYSELNYNLKDILNPNMTAFKNLEKIISLIPKNDPYVVIDPNLPQILPRTQVENGPLLVPPASLAYNLSYFSYSGKWEKARIDYVLAYINGSGYHWKNNYPYNMSMYDLVNTLYGSGEYGLVAEASGIVLLERNYTGPMKYYYPDNRYYSASNYFSNSPFYGSNGLICVTNYTTPKGQWSQAWGGPFIYLAPGYYNVTFELSTTNTSANNNIDLIVSYYPENNMLTTLNSTVITGSDFSKPGQWINVSLNIFISNFAKKVEFRGDYMNWNGTLYFKGVMLKQISPGFVVYRAGNSYDVNLFYQILENYTVKNSTILVQSGFQYGLPYYKVYTPQDYLISYNTTYILADMISPTFSLKGNSPYNMSMYDLVNSLYGSGEYGFIIGDSVKMSEINRWFNEN